MCTGKCKNPRIQNQSDCSSVIHTFITLLLIVSVISLLLPSPTVHIHLFFIWKFYLILENIFCECYKIFFHEQLLYYIISPECPMPRLQILFCHIAAAVYCDMLGKLPGHVHILLLIDMEIGKCLITRAYSTALTLMCFLLVWLVVRETSLANICQFQSLAGD